LPVPVIAAGRSSGGFGVKLRDARERRGLSLRALAHATKISVAVLEALERDDISRLPGGIFSRAFVRSYAVEVGLDPDATIHDFIAQFPNSSVTTGHSTRDSVEDGVSVDSDRRMAGTFLWLLGLSIPIAGALLYYGAAGRGIGRQRTAEPSTATAADSKPPTEPPDSASGGERERADAVAPGTAATMPPATPAVATPVAATPVEATPPVSTPAAATPVVVPPTATTPPAALPAAAAPATAAPVADRLTVLLSVRRACWVTAIVDGQTTIERLLQPGDQQTIDVTRDMVLTAGDASAVMLTLNGAPARPLGASGELVTVRFNPATYKDYLQPR